MTRQELSDAIVKLDKLLNKNDDLIEQEDLFEAQEVSWELRKALELEEYMVEFSVGKEVMATTPQDAEEIARAQIIKENGITAEELDKLYLYIDGDLIR